MTIGVLLSAHIMRLSEVHRSPHSPRSVQQEEEDGSAEDEGASSY